MTIFHGWIKYGMNGMWQPACRDTTEDGCWELLNRIRPENTWHTVSVLPSPETPLAHIMMREKRLR